MRHSNPKEMKLDWCVIQIHIKDNFPSSENYLSEVQAYEA